MKIKCNYGRGCKKPAKLFYLRYGKYSYGGFAYCENHPMPGLFVIGSSEFIPVKHGWHSVTLEEYLVAGVMFK